MGETLNIGILGAIAGYAGGKVDDIDAQNAEALRLRKEESEILKARRLAQIQQEMETEARNQRLAEMGLRDPQGNLITSGLDQDLASVAGPSNIEKLLEEQQLRERDRLDEADNITTVAPGNTFGTTAAVRAAAGGGLSKTPDRPQSSSQVMSEFGRIKSEVRSNINSQVGSITGSERRGLLEASLRDVDDPTDSQASVYQSFLADLATSIKFSEWGDSIRENPDGFEFLNSDAQTDAILQYSREIDEGYREALDKWVERMQARDRTQRQAGKALNSDEKRTVARSILNSTFEYKTESNVNFKETFKAAGIWNDYFEAIAINTLITSTSLLDLGNKK